MPDRAPGRAKAWTYDNIAAMKKQLQSIGLSLDWSREFATCDPSYYKHQQKLFLDFLRAGLAERERAQGQLGSGRHDRARQRAGDRWPWWRFRRAGRAARDEAVGVQDIKIFAGLLDALDTLDRWPDKVRLMHATGSDEARVADPFRARSGTAPNGESELKIFTTRHDTLFGAKFMATRRIIRWHRRRLQRSKAGRIHRGCKTYGTAQEIIDTAEKLGFDTGSRRSIVRSGLEVPIYVANFVLMEYGTGAIFGCPAHDQRDLDFVNKYGLGNTPVVCPPDVDPKTFVITDTAYDGTAA